MHTMHVCVYIHIYLYIYVCIYIYLFSGYYSVVRYITGKDAFLFCGLCLQLTDCFFRAEEAFQFCEISFQETLILRQMESFPKHIQCRTLLFFWQFQCFRVHSYVFVPFGVRCKVRTTDLISFICMCTSNWRNVKKEGSNKGGR